MKSKIYKSLSSQEAGQRGAPGKEGLRKEDIERTDRRCRFGNWRWFCRKPAAGTAGTVGVWGEGRQVPPLLSVCVTGALLSTLLTTLWNPHQNPVRHEYPSLAQGSYIPCLVSLDKWQKWNLSPDMFWPQSPFLRWPNLRHQLFLGSEHSAVRLGGLLSWQWVLREGSTAVWQPTLKSLSDLCLERTGQSPRFPGSHLWYIYEGDSVSSILTRDFPWALSQ